MTKLTMDQALSEEFFLHCMKSGNSYMDDDHMMPCMFDWSIEMFTTVFENLKPIVLEKYNLSRTDGTITGMLWSWKDGMDETVFRKLRTMPEYN